MLGRLSAAPVLCALAVVTSAAQSPSDLARCRGVLTRATADSVSVHIGLSITSFDTTALISPGYRGLFVQALRQELKLPRPLALELYGFYTPRNAQGGVIGSTTVVPTVAGSYRVTLKRDGHFTNARVVGGARTRAFDDAFLAAVRAVGDSQSAPPFPEDIQSADSVDVRIGVQIPDAIRPAQAGLPPAIPFDPLFIIRVPSLGFPSQVAKPLPGNPAPRFPSDARRGNVDGRVIAQFVVDASGAADLNSVQIVQATAVSFVAAVLEVLPQHRFTPLAMDGCPVASLVMQPFDFHIAR